MSIAAVHQSRAGSTPPFPAVAAEPSVVAGMGYLIPGAERPYTYMYDPPPGVDKQNCDFVMAPMAIADARAFAAKPALEAEGFELWQAPSRVRDFRDDDEVARVYYPEAAELACTATGGSRAVVFDHQVRQREAGRPALGFGRSGDGAKPAAVGRVHNDYSEASGRKRLDLVLGDAAVGVGRYAIVNIWRSIAGPVLDTPLAVCDARSVLASELIASEIRYADRRGEIYLAHHSPRHRWAYFSAMDRHEALVFKQYDSQAGGVSRFTLHAAFDHPRTPPDAPLRQSIEVRCLVLFP